MREHRAVLYTANGCVTQTRLRVCLVHNSMAFANQQGLYACVNVISIFHGKGPLSQTLFKSYSQMPYCHGGHYQKVWQTEGLHKQFDSNRSAGGSCSDPFIFKKIWIHDSGNRSLPTTSWYCTKLISNNQGWLHTEHITILSENFPLLLSKVWCHNTNSLW